MIQISKLLQHTYKSIFVLFQSFVVIGFICGNSHAYEEDMVVYSNLKGYYADHAGEFHSIIRNSLDKLNRFSVSSNKDSYADKDSDLDERLEAADENQAPWLANVELDTEKKSGNINLQIFRTTGENVYTWKEKIKIKNLKSFLATLEYKLPIQLKTKFLELGRVIKTDNRMIYFDLGETASVKVGDTFRIYAEGDEITDDDGNSFGNLEVTTGVVEVREVTGVYSIAEIIIGQLSIETEQWVKKIDKNSAEFKGEILAVLENKIAVNIGKNVGVEEGSYYAVFRDIKAINGKEAFRQPVGHIKINEVYDDFSKGELSISDSFDMSKYTIKKGDRITEVDSPRKNMWSINQLMTNISKDNTARVMYVAYQQDSLINVNMVYRAKLGYGDGNPFASAGVMHSMGHSAHVFAGMDVLYVGDTALNMFINVDVDTPISKDMKITLESGFVVAHGEEKYNGLNVSLGFKYALDLF